MNKPSSFKSRSRSRLLAVQALFQIESTGSSPTSVITEFLSLRFAESKKEGQKGNSSFFSKVVEGAWTHHSSYDDMIQGTLKTGWTLERLEPVTRAILRAALYELTETTTPTAVLIDEYLNLTRDFFDDTEVSFVNGVLNTLAHKLRPS